MKTFNDNNFLLQSPTAERLYHEYAAPQPIIDYHCHLNPEYVANDHRFDNLAEIWLEGDHYKWRAMRTNGIDERYITGDSSFREKFTEWAKTVPYTMCNPLYHWTHLELKTAFGVNELLMPSTAEAIYEKCSAMLRTPEFSARGLMKHYRVETVCTTDDPIDSLEHHIKVRDDASFNIKMLPTWRPDKAMAVENTAAFNTYVDRLGELTDTDIRSFDTLIAALQVRHDFFASVGCRLSDHGLNGFYAEDYTANEVETIFQKIRGGQDLNPKETAQFKSAMMIEFGMMDHESGWTQQIHYGALRNNNSRMFQTIGPDTGFDSIGDYTVAEAMSRYLDKLDAAGKLPKTIIYNLNPRDNELVATMIGNFQDGRYGAGKIQFGSGWWFLDQKLGIENQLGALSVLGLLSRFVGMLTDSRSFLSYPRHEYFRRILCNMLGNQIETGLLPASEIEFIGREIVAKVAYGNAKEYFNF